MEFKEFQLGDLAKYNNDKISVFEVKKENYISTENMLPNKKGIGDNAKLPEKGKVNVYVHGDILISNIRPYFKKIWFADNIGSHSTDVLNLRITSKEVLSKYLYYYVFQDRFFEYMTTSSKGTKMPRGDKQAIMKYPVFIPDINIQSKIVSILSNLDDKIQNNLYIIDRLEQISQTLFKRWFIDFEFPNEEGQPYKSSGGKMVESELGEIPEGWEVKNLDNIANFQNGLAMQKHRPKGEDFLPVLKIKELNQGFTDANSDACDVNIKDSVKVKNGDIVFSWSGTLLVKIWSGGDAGLNQHLFKVTSKDYDSWFYYQWLNYYLKTFKMRAAEKATTMGHIKRSHLSEAKVIVPEKHFFEKNSLIFEHLFQLILEKSIENKNLEQLRDTLLPKLLSGEIEIPDDLEV